MRNIESCLKQIVSRLISNFHPEKIILFGSYSYGVPTSDSDIDLMVVMETRLKPHKRAIARAKPKR